MNANVTKEKVDEILSICNKNIDNDNCDNFRSYEEGVKDALEWLFYDNPAPEVGCDDEL